MLKLTCEVTIYSTKTWTFNRVTEVEIVKDSESLTDTCKLTLPKKVRWHNEERVPIKRGDKVSVSLGYDGNNTHAFSGYVTNIGIKTPLVISCEDEMFRLKQLKAVKKAYKQATIKQLLDDQNIGCEVKVLGKQSIGAYRQNAETVAELLNSLAEQGVHSFFRVEEGKPVLYAGVLFDHSAPRRQVYDNHKNIIDDSSLERQVAEDMKIRVKAISLNENNKKTTVEVGDTDGEVRTIHRRAVSEAELKEWAEQELTRLKRDGLTGELEVFGGEIIDKLDVIGIVIDGKKQGEYQVKKNTITYGTGGFRQKIELGQRTDGSNTEQI